MDTGKKLTVLSDKVASVIVDSRTIMIHTLHPGLHGHFIQDPFEQFPSCVNGHFLDGVLPGKLDFVTK